MTALLHLIGDETGQDVVEYSLLLAFVTVISAALFFSGGDSVKVILCKTDENLSRAVEGPH